MTSTYLQGLDHLIAEGLYLGRGEIVLASLRRTLRGYGVEPFYREVREIEVEPEKVPEKEPEKVPEKVPEKEPEKVPEDRSREED